MIPHYNSFVWSIVITKNFPAQLEKFFVSYTNNLYLRAIPVVVIDDSTTNESIEDNGSILEWYSICVYHVHKYNYKSILWDGLSKMNEWVVLWSKKWNTGNVRTVTNIFKSCVWTDKQFVFQFDDDIIFKKWFNPNTLLYKTNIHSVVASRFSGCPDLSNLEWIGLYSYVVSSIVPKKNKAYNFLYSLVRKLWFVVLDKIIKRYIDFGVWTIQGSDRDIDGIYYPHRERPWWLCLLIENNEKYNLVVPNIYDEDRIMLGMIKNQWWTIGWVKEYITHFSRNKTIDFVKESFSLEYEKIVAELFCKYWLSLWLSQIKRKVHAIVSYRKQLINTYRDNLLSLDSKSITKHKYIVDYLEWFKEKYDAEDEITSLVTGMYTNYTNSFMIIPKSDNTIKVNKTLFFSPHLDDIQLSVWSFIDTVVWEKLIYNVFTKSSYTIEWFGDLDKVSEQRRLENEQVFLERGIKNIYLDYLDACDFFWKNLHDFMNYNFDALSSPIFIQLEKHITECCQKDAIHFFPLWIWWHVDHLLLMRIGKHMAKKGYNVYFYVDIWYDDSCDLHTIKAYVDKVFSKKYLCTLIKMQKDDFDDKYAHIKKYVSQVGNDLDQAVCKNFEALHGEMLFQILF